MCKLRHFESNVIIEIPLFTWIINILPGFFKSKENEANDVQTEAV